MVGQEVDGPRGEGMPEEPSLEKLRESIVERVGAIESRNALLAIDAVVSLQEPPFDPALSLEAFLGVAELVAGMQLMEAVGLEAAGQVAGEEDDREPS